MRGGQLRFLMVVVAFLAGWASHSLVSPAGLSASRAQQHPQHDQQQQQQRAHQLGRREQGVYEPSTSPPPFFPRQGGKPSTQRASSLASSLLGALAPGGSRGNVAQQLDVLAQDMQYPHLQPLPEATAKSLQANEFAMHTLHHHGLEPGPVRVCLVTSALAGPTPSGGVGTAFHAIAMHLAEATSPAEERLFSVTVVYAAHPWYGRGKEEDWIAHFAKHRIRFLPLTTDVPKFYGPKLVVRSYKVMELLRQHEAEFDVVTFHDHMGIGYFTTLLKHQGLAFQNTFLFVQGHGTIRWADHHNFRPPKDHNTLAYYYMEQKAVERADARVFPSRYYLDWLQGPHARFDLTSTGHNFVVQNLLYPQPSDEQAVSVHRPQHFVFFGRLEVRKGLLVFLEALALLNPEEVPHVSFLGPSVSINNKKSAQVIEEHLSRMDWPKHAYSLQTKLNSEEALQYIKDHNAVAVIPTLGDNSPYVVIELVALEIPLITTTAGGGAELLKTVPESDPFVVPPNDAGALANAVRHATKHGIPNYHTAVPFSTTRGTYLSLIRAFAALRHREDEQADRDALQEEIAANAHATGRRRRAKQAPTGAHNDDNDSDDDFRALLGVPITQRVPRVLLGITSHNRPRDLERAVQSLVDQHYPGELMTVMIVDDASTDSGMNASLSKAQTVLEAKGVGHHIVTHHQHRFVAQTRNDIIQHAASTGNDFVCFLDDDDEALDVMVSTYMKVALRTGADLLTDISDNYDWDNEGKLVFSHRSLSLGDGLSHNLFLNNFGKANFCVRPDRALAIGGHYDTMPYADSPYVDWSFLTRASLAGLHIELVPLPLYRYTKYSTGSIWYERTGRVDKYNGHYKILQDALAYVPPKMADFVTYCRYKLGQPHVPADGPL